MRIAVVAPSPVPFEIGGAEKLCWGLLEYFNRETAHHAELVKLPFRERDLWSLVDGYRRFAELDLSHFDLVISTKYPSWMVSHPNHVCYMLHRLRGLYDTYHFMGQPLEVPGANPAVASLIHFMEEHRAERAALPEAFARLLKLQADQGAQPDLFAFPGPLARKVVHFLDGIGLARSEVRRFLAISRTVASRQDYFPRAAQVEVAYPPTSLTGLHTGSYDYLLSVSRLDGPKRTHLAIEALDHVAAPVKLLIAGTGPDEAILRQRAARDDRIQVLGFVNDSRLAELYANALAVLFFPYQEDYGLITIEGMRCAKPVVTASDSGGPTELVEHGVSGFVVEPSPEAIAARVEQLYFNPDEARTMGRKGQQRVEGITWAAVVSQLLAERPASRSVVASGGRQTLTVCSTFPVFPPRHGGQLRIFNLYRHLATEFNVEIVTLTQTHDPISENEIAMGVREFRVPKSAQHEAAEARLSAEIGYIPVTDIAFGELFRLTPDLVRVLGQSLSRSNFSVASHPYSAPALLELAGRISCYESHNVEVDLKRDLLPPGSAGKRLLELTSEIERLACSRSSLVTFCSDQDGPRLQELYGIPPHKMVLIPNGVDLEKTTFTGPMERRKRKNELGLEGAFVALFLGSWHGPNLEAVRSLLEMSRQCPDIRFILAGGASLAFQKEQLPANVALAGVIDDEEKEELLKAADLAVNPVTSGSGTNLKTLEYCAAGIPVLTTPHGLRGLLLREGEHVECCPRDEFAQVLEELKRGREYPPERIANARRLMETHYDWRMIAECFRTKIRSAMG